MKSPWFQLGLMATSGKGISGATHWGTKGVSNFLGFSLLLRSELEKVFI